MLPRVVARLPTAATATRQCSTISFRRPHRPALPIPTTPRRPPVPSTSSFTTTRPASSSSSSSSTRWKSRATHDPFTHASRLAGLKSRAAFKLLEIDTRHSLFRRGDTVVDLGYAPGSWSQVAVNRVGEGGRVVGIDVIPAQPPRGVSTLQGDFLSEAIQGEVRAFVREGHRGRGRRRGGIGRKEEGGELTAEGMEGERRWVVERGVRRGDGAAAGVENTEVEGAGDRVVDVVLSDMSEPWPLAGSSWIRSVSNPYHRMMNTSGTPFRDHAGSMDLCNAALTFCYDTLVSGGNFLCKFYQGAEDHALELRLKKLFEKVHRIKPESSRKESREAYFVCLRRREDVARDAVLGEGG